MANSTQYLPVFRSGFTGPSERIGGSSPYHIDLKILSSLPLSEKIRALDSLANQYKQIGREIEFSNEAVSGKRWDPTLPLDEKVALFEAVRGAHAARPGWDPLDFYVPFAGKSRFDTGAVEGASIYIPGVEGGKIIRGSGGGYGYFSEAVDPSGRVVFRVGHGDINRPEEQKEIVVEAQAPVVQQNAPVETPQTKPADTLLAEKLGELLKPAGSPVYTGPDLEVYRKRRQTLDDTMMKLLASQANTQPQTAAPTTQYQPPATNAIAATLAQSSFGTPKSLI